MVEEAARYFVEKKPADRVHSLLRSRTTSATRTAGCRTRSSRPFARPTSAWRRCSTPSSAAGLDGETLFIISADHGGHGHNHDGKIPEDRLIPWIAWGPGIRAGHRIKADISTVDTAATALWVLGYPPPPGMVGRPVLEAFEPDPP